MCTRSCGVINGEHYAALAARLDHFFARRPGVRPPLEDHQIGRSAAPRGRDCDSRAPRPAWQIARWSTYCRARNSGPQQFLLVASIRRGVVSSARVAMKAREPANPPPIARGPFAKSIRRIPSRRHIARDIFVATTRSKAVAPSMLVMSLWPGDLDHSSSAFSSPSCRHRCWRFVNGPTFGGRLVARARMKSRLRKGFGRLIAGVALQRRESGSPRACAPPSRLEYRADWPNFIGRPAMGVVARALHMVPEGMNTAASCEIWSATVRIANHRRTSSPIVRRRPRRSIASRIAAVWRSACPTQLADGIGPWIARGRGSGMEGSRNWQRDEGKAFMKRNFRVRVVDRLFTPSLHSSLDLGRIRPRHGSTPPDRPCQEDKMKRPRPQLAPSDALSRRGSALTPPPYQRLGHRRRPRFSPLIERRQRAVEAGRHVGKPTIPAADLTGVCVGPDRFLQAELPFQLHHSGRRGPGQAGCSIR